MSDHSGHDPYGSGRVPDYDAIARELEQIGRTVAERATATGDGSLVALAQRLGGHAAQIREDLDGSGLRRFAWRLGMLNLKPDAANLDLADWNPCAAAE